MNLDVCNRCTYKVTQRKKDGVEEVITEKQKALIDDMNEFCTEKFKYDENTTKAEAREYISRNIEQFKLLTMDNWQMQYL